jgi:hypothetical protein
MDPESLDLIKKYSPAISWLLSDRYDDRPYYNCDDCPFSVPIKGWGGDRFLPDIKCQMLGKDGDSSWFGGSPHAISFTDWRGVKARFIVAARK